MGVNAGFGTGRLLPAGAVPPEEGETVYDLVADGLLMSAT